MSKDDKRLVDQFGKPIYFPTLSYILRKLNSERGTASLEAPSEKSAQVK